MGWLRLVGSLKLQVSFAKEPYKKKLYSAKETYNLKEPTNRSHPIHVNFGDTLCSGVMSHVMTIFTKKSYISENHQIEKLRFRGISQYKFKLRFGFILYLYQGI